MSARPDHLHWEIPMAPEKLDAFPESSGLHFEPAGQRDDRWHYSAKLQGLADRVRQLMRERLTPPQREVVVLYFLEGKTQGEIAERLGISQQAISTRLFWKVRRGHRVGGAVRALQGACDSRAVSPGVEPERQPLVP